MRNQVIARPRQQLLERDVNNIQTYVRSSMDEGFRAAIGATRRYIGLHSEAIGPAEIRVNSGQLAMQGEFYGLDTAQTFDMISNLPVAAQRKAAIVAWGTETETDIERRNFRTDVSTNQVEPQDVAVRRGRVANVDIIYGLESANPVLPPFDVGYVHVASITLSTTGIVNVTMNETARLKSTQDLFISLEQFNIWKQLVEPMIATLRTDITGLADRLRSTVSRQTMDQVIYDVAILKDAVGIDEDAVTYGADRYLNTDKMDLKHGQSNCRIEEGIRANHAGIVEQALSLFNPLDPAATMHANTGMLMPKYTEIQRSANMAYAGDMSINQYASRNIELTQRTASRERIRYGQTMDVCTNAEWWKSGQYDPATGIFRKDGETWQVVGFQANYGVGHEILRVSQFWHDSWQEPYWDAIQTVTNINGAVIAQTVLNSQGGWYLGSEFFFTEVAADGPVTMAICETIAGEPDFTKVIASVTKQPNELSVYPAATRFGLPPMYLERGKRYARVLISQASHRVAISNNNAFLDGSLFISTDGGWFQGDLEKDLLFRDFFAGFSSPRTVIELQPVSLSGGITDLDFLYDSITPDGTQLTWEIQPEGQSLWSRLEGGTGQSLLYNKPALVRVRAVFTGTSDLQPMIRLTGSRLRATRSATAWVGVSDIITLPDACSTISVISYLGYFETNEHTVTISLLSDTDAAFTASVVEDKLAEKGTRRKVTFQLATPLTKFRIKHTCAAQTDRNLFQINETVWNAY